MTEVHQSDYQITVEPQQYEINVAVTQPSIDAQTEETTYSIPSEENVIQVALETPEINFIASIEAGNTYTDEDAIKAINEDADHGSTAQHSKSDVGLDKLVNSLQVINSGGAKSIQAVLSTDVPAPGTAGRFFLEKDGKQRLLYDTGSTMVEKARQPAQITAGDLGFDPATQSELDTHAGTPDAHHAKYTDEEARDTVAAFLKGGTNVTLTHNDSGDELTIDATDTQLTDEEVQDIVGAFVTGGTGISATYDDAANTLTIAISSVTESELSLSDNTTADATSLKHGLMPKVDKTKIDYLTVTASTDLDTIRQRVNELDAAIVLQGDWDASTGSFPGGGSAEKGQTWIVSTAGTVDGVNFSVNDRLLAITDNASTSTYADNWLKLDYTDQVLSVFGRTGNVAAQEGDYDVALLADAALPNTMSAGQLLIWNATNSQFENALLSAGYAVSITNADGSITIAVDTSQLDPSDVDLGNVPNVKQNLTATSDPTLSDDTDAGYSVGSRWINTDTDEEFVCQDASSGAAVWKSTTSGGGGGLTWQVISSNTTASAGNGYLANVSGGALTLTLPGSPSTGDKVGVCDFYSNSETNAITIDRNGNNIEGASSNYTIATNGASYVFCYSDSTRGWEIIHESGTASGGTGYVTESMYNSLLNRISVNAFRALTNGDLAGGEYVEGVIDSYEDESQIDTAASSNQNYDSTGEYYEPTTPVKVQDLDETQSEFQDGTLADVEADSGGYLRLADTDVLSFDGTDDRVDLTDDPFDLSGPLTIEAWVYIRSADSKDKHAILGKYDGNDGYNVRLWYGGSDHSDYICGFFFGGSPHWGSNDVVPADTWTHLAFVWDSNNNKIIYYKNGTVIETLSSISETIPSNNNIARLGDNGVGLDLLAGEMNDVRVWTEARTQTEIQNNMNKRLTGSETNLFAYYKLDEGTGTTATDSAGSNDGSISGASWVTNEPLYFNNSGENNRRLNPQLDLSSVGTVNTSSISWTETLNSQSITIECRVSFDNGSTWSSWQTATNGGSIPGLSSGDDVSNGLLECRQYLSTTDVTKTPQLDTLDIQVTANPDNMTLISSAVTVETVPDNGRIISRIKEVDSITLNTDLTAEISNNGGTDWDTVTLQKVADYSGLTVVAGSSAFTGSSTDLEYRLTTANNKALEVHNTALLGD